MIKSFNHKGLKVFFETGSAKGIRADHVNKIQDILWALNDINNINELNNLWGCHKLKGSRSNIWSLKVSGNWRITFEFTDGDVYILDYEDYH